MSRQVTLKTGWLIEDLDRAAKQVNEWSARPITKAQPARALEREPAHASKESESDRKLPENDSTCPS